jgi:hypothetical protein
MRRRSRPGLVKAFPGRDLILLETVMSIVLLDRQPSNCVPIDQVADPISSLLMRRFDCGSTLVRCQDAQLSAREKAIVADQNLSQFDHLASTNQFAA